MSEEFESDPLATKDRRDALQKYFESIATEDAFCSSFADCKKSHNGAFYENQQPHVGDHYDLKRRGRPFRVVIVGQECGDPQANLTMEERHRIILQSGIECRFLKEPPWPGRNPHMRGTTSALRLLFGYDVGADYCQEFISISQEKTHVFDCFALVNYLMCSAVDGRTTKGRSKSTMQNSCARHFRAILRILEPTVIIVQGKYVREWISTYKSLQIPLQPPRCLIEHVQIETTEAILFSFSHPSSIRDQLGNDLNWGRNHQTKYLRDTVVPTIREGLSRLGFANTAC